MRTIKRLTANSSGQLIVAAIAVILIIAVFLPLIVMHVRNEARWAIKEKQSTTAFHLAEAAVDRGLWKLTEQDQNWIDAKNGTVISGYDDGTVYTDVPGGTYKVKFTSGPSTGQVTVRGKGLDTKTKEMRVVEAVYTKDAVNAGMQINGTLNYKPNLRVHWGPVVTYQSITSSPSDYYPRKFAKGSIAGRDTVNDSNNTDNLEYWAFYEDLGTPPIVDTAYYKAKAQASRIPLTSSSPNGDISFTNFVASPTGSGYFVATGNGSVTFDKIGGASNFYQYRNSTSVIYVDGGAYTCTTSVKNAFLDLEGFIVAGSGNTLDIKANNYDGYGATIPATAALEYQKAAATWATFSTPGAGNCCYTLNDLFGHGFFYSEGDAQGNASANANFHGVFMINGNSSNMNTTTIYYDDSVASNIHLKSGSPRRVSWKETKTTW